MKNTDGFININSNLLEVAQQLRQESFNLVDAGITKFLASKKDAWADEAMMVLNMTVYEAYTPSSGPKGYFRTYKLLNSVKAEMVESSNIFESKLSIFADSNETAIYKKDLTKRIRNVEMETEYTDPPAYSEHVAFGTGVFSEEFKAKHRKKKREYPGARNFVSEWESVFALKLEQSKNEIEKSIEKNFEIGKVA